MSKQNFGGYHLNTLKEEFSWQEIFAEFIAKIGPFSDFLFLFFSISGAFLAVFEVRNLTICEIKFCKISLHKLSQHINKKKCKLNINCPKKAKLNKT